MHQKMNHSKAPANLMPARASRKATGLARMRGVLGTAAAALALTLVSAAPPALAAECPNEQFRTGPSAHLPDCRAYELVSPPRKNGAVPATSGPGSVSADGSRVSFSSIGAFNEPGNASTVEGGEYVAIRGVEGWATMPVNPSATEFWGGSPETGTNTLETSDYSENLSQTVFMQAPLSSKPIDSRIYVREVEGGSFAEVGPIVPPETAAAWSSEVAVLTGYYGAHTRYAGATGDFSRILFTQENNGGPFGWLWPGDETLSGRPSLYEYAGVGNAEPELVAVNNQTTLAAAQATDHLPHLNEAAELISDCGGQLGSINTSLQIRSRYNAISAAGSTVYFTALSGGCEAGGELGSGPPVAELDARIDRAQTVALSMPSRESCSSCELSEVTSLPWDGHEFAGNSEEKVALSVKASQLTPYFQGASRDGSRAFFVSRQKLFGGANKEAGGNLYEYDFNAPSGKKLSLIAPDLPQGSEESDAGGGVVRVAEQGDLVYFVSEDALAQNADALGRRAIAGEGNFNLYVFNTETRTTTFIAALAGRDEADWMASDERTPEATPDGRFLLFGSVNALTPDASGSLPQLYRYEAPSAGDPTGSLIRITVGEDGFNNDGNISPTPEYPYAPTYTHRAVPGYGAKALAKPAGVQITADGSRIFFASPIALTTEALNEACVYEAEGECSAVAQNVYEWERGQIYLISDGRDTHSIFRFSATQLVGSNPSGSDVFFTTADPLVAQDGDTQVDIYDARVGGGFPAQMSPASCGGEACQGVGSQPPPLLMPSSASLESAGNLSGPLAQNKPKPPTRAQKLTRALDVCRKMKRHNARKKCERQARKRYGAKPKAPAQSHKRSK